MKCPNCGKEINGNQKFCTSCGARIDNTINEKDNDENIEIEETNIADNQETEIAEGKISELFNTHANKIIAIILCLILIPLSVLGIIQHKQYHKDIEPYKTNISFYNSSDVECTLTFDEARKKAYLSMLYKDVIVQQWQVDYLNENNGTYKLTDNGNKYTFEFENIKLNVGEPLVLNFKINEVKNLKDFAQLKQDFDNISLMRSIPNVLSEDPKIRLSEKQKWLDLKEQERKQKEWQENVLSNCVYKTSDGVCFTTTAFYPDPLNYYDCTGGLTTYNVASRPTQELSNIGIHTCYDHYDNWAGAMKLCNDWGYKLPDAHELASLAKDIYGVPISEEENISTYLPDGYKLNKKLMDRLKINDNTITRLYENIEKTNYFAYTRTLHPFYTAREAHVKEYYQKNIPPLQSICVYNPVGKPKFSFEQYVKQKEAERLKQEQLKKQREQNATKIENYEDLERYFQKTNNQSQNNTNKTRVESAEDDLF